MVAVTRRADLAEFLRARRAALRPADVGLPEAGRRRTQGLRREEVALLAGVSVSWYTWLEQGRPINASVDVLDALARALQLDAVERDHLLALAGHPARRPVAPGRNGVSGRVASPAPRAGARAGVCPRTALGLRRVESALRSAVPGRCRAAGRELQSRVGDVRECRRARARGRLGTRGPPGAVAVPRRDRARCATTPRWSGWSSGCARRASSSRNGGRATMSAGSRRTAASFTIRERDASSSRPSSWFRPVSPICGSWCTSRSPATTVRSASPQCRPRSRPRKRPNSGVFFPVPLEFRAAGRSSCTRCSQSGRHARRQRPHRHRTATEGPRHHATRVCRPRRCARPSWRPRDWSPPLQRPTRDLAMTRKPCCGASGPACSPRTSAPGTCWPIP